MVRWGVFSTVAVIAATTMAGVVLRSQGSNPTGNPASLISPAPTTQVASAKRQGQKLPVTAQVTVADTTIDLEVARTDKQRRIGLMYRRSLEKNRGMLFLFDPPRAVRFWMKNTLIPLDMIFLRDGQVQKVVTAAPPCEQSRCPTYGMEKTAVDQVIELRAGRAEELGIQEGDRLTVEFLEDRSPSAQETNFLPSELGSDRK